MAAASGTGYKVSFGAHSLPYTRGRENVSPDALNAFDGFSTLAPILFYLEVGRRRGLGWGVGAAERLLLAARKIRGAICPSPLCRTPLSRSYFLMSVSSIGYYRGKEPNVMRARLHVKPFRCLVLLMWVVLRAFGILPVV